MRLPIFVDFLNRLELKEVGISLPNRPSRMIGISSDKPSGAQTEGGRGVGVGGPFSPVAAISSILRETMRNPFQGHFSESFWSDRARRQTIDTP